MDWKLKDYLGDGVYALYDGFSVWLHANDHENPTDRICLESEVLEALERFVSRCRQLSRASAPESREGVQK